MAKVTLILLIQCVLLWAPKWIYELRWYFTLEPLTFTWYLAQLFGMVAVYVNACLTPFTVVVCSRAFRHQLGKVRHHPLAEPFEGSVIKVSLYLTTSLPSRSP